jgi:hypothetical protein
MRKYPHDERFSLRLNAELKEALAAAARRQMRSLCREIEFRLQQALQHDDAALGREEAQA